VGGGGGWGGGGGGGEGGGASKEASIFSHLDERVLQRRVLRKRAHQAEKLGRGPKTVKPLETRGQGKTGHQQSRVAWPRRGRKKANLVLFSNGSSGCGPEGVLREDPSREGGHKRQSRLQT